MNSLSYLSKQFDALASTSTSRTPPHSNETDPLLIRPPTPPQQSSSSPSSPSKRRRKSKRSILLRSVSKVWGIFCFWWTWLLGRKAALYGITDDEAEEEGEGIEHEKILTSPISASLPPASDESSPILPTTLVRKRRSPLSISIASSSNTHQGISFAPATSSQTGSPRNQDARPPLTPFPKFSPPPDYIKEEQEEPSLSQDDPTSRTMPTLDFTPPTPQSPPAPLLSPQSPTQPPPSQQLLPNPLPNLLLSPSRRSSTPPNLTPSISRASTPTSSKPITTPFHLPKTLVLDLDETLIHSTSSRTAHHHSRSDSPSGGSSVLNLGGLFLGGGFGGAGLLSLSAGFGGGLIKGGGGGSGRAGGHMVEVVMGGRSTLYTVYKRPFVDYFLRKVSGWYTLVIFTASMQEYADPVIDWLDAGRGILTRRLFRESCTQLPNGSYAKDLSLIDPDLARVFLIDNSPASYSLDQANGIPIEGWTSEPSDEALLDLLPVLDSLRFTGDVRRVLGIRGF